ncbi:hypothetical protein GA0115259_108219 [Streptomyces sp. MnatMP-M17]|nr:hypothetical protein GA0115259_108219 [Streptomyces sp. MnatMP-M17]
MRSRRGPSARWRPRVQRAGCDGPSSRVPCARTGCPQEGHRSSSRQRCTGQAKDRHRNGEFALHPAAGHRLHREDVKPVGVQHHVLARSRRAQPAVNPLRPVGDRPFALGAALERVRAFGQLPQHLIAISARRQRNRSPAMVLGETFLDLQQDQVPHRPRGLLVSLQHRPSGIRPPRIHPVHRPAHRTFVHQTGGTGPLHPGDPPADRRRIDPDVRRPWPCSGASAAPPAHSRDEARPATPVPLYRVGSWCGLPGHGEASPSARRPRCPPGR